MKKLLFILVLGVCSFYFWSCNGSSQQQDSPTSGDIKVYMDETLQPVLDSNVSVFESLYRNTKIRPVFTSEGEAFTNLLNDSTRLIIATRKLNKEEQKYFEQIKIVPRTTRIAYDAVALICNKKNKDSLLSMNLIKDIFSGQITKWKQVSGSSKLGEIQLIFENSGASTVRYMRDLVNNAPLPKNAYEVKTCDKIIDYVQKNENAIGVIGVNWISDNSDSTALKFLDKITVMELNAKLSFYPGLDDFYKPYQAYIATGDYPLKREVYCISREAYTGLATGFSGFVASEKGQRIFLRSGLVPATMPVRLVEVKDRDIQVEKEKQ